MIEIVECEKTCLKAEKEKILYNADAKIYTPKVYLFESSEKYSWVELDKSEVKLDDDLEDAEALEILLGGSR